MEVNRTNIISCIVGGMVLGMVMVHCDNEFVKGSDIKIRTKILKHTTPFLAQLEEDKRNKIATIVFDSIVDTDGENMKVNPVVFIESIAFSFEKELRAFYDGDIMDVITRWCNKNMEYAPEDSYEYADKVRDNVRKNIFDRLEELVLE